MNNIINPDDRDYYDGKLYEVGIWPGAGYQLTTFKVYAANEQEALELVVADAELNNENLLMSIPEMENYIAEDWSEECANFMQENEDRDADEYTFAEEYLNYIYVDATMQGASQPYFVNGENLSIREISENDKVEESKEIKEEAKYYEIHFKLNEDDEAPEGYSKFFYANKDMTNEQEIIDYAKMIGEIDPNEDDIRDIDYAKQIDEDEYHRATGISKAEAKYLDTTDQASKEEKECQNKLVEDTDNEEHIIWDSEIDYYDEDYKNEIKDNQYQDYLDNFEPTIPEPKTYEEWLDWTIEDWVEEGSFETYDEAEDYAERMEADLREQYEEYAEDFKQNAKPTEPLEFEEWYENYIEDSSYDDWDVLKDDLENNILPTIDSQINDNVLILSGYYGSNYPDFKSSGEGGKLFEGLDDFRQYMGGFDRATITTQSGILGSTLYDHDGTVSGEFYTLPDDKTELIKAMGYEDIIKERYDEEDLDKYNENDLMETEFNNDLYYGGIDASDLNKYIDLLKPIKDTISGYAPTDPDKTKTESKDIKIEDKDTEDLLKEIADEALDIIRDNKELVDRYYGPEAEYTDDYYNFMKDVCNSLNVDYDLIPDEKRGIIDSIIQNELFGTKTESKDIKTENNKIPRNWKKITYKSKIDTNVDKIGDTIEIERDEWNRPIATNLRTGETALVFLDMVRNEELSEIVDIETADTTKTESKKDLDINSNKKYKKVQVTFECDDCGHKENYLYDNLSEKDLAELEASDSNTLVGDCPKCNSKYYNMKDYKIMGESKEVKTERLSHRDLEDLAKDIYDWYDSDMGTHFDEVQGNEESVYGDIMTALETKDQAQIQNFIDTIKEADISDEDAKATNIATTSSLIARLSELLTVGYNNLYEAKEIEYITQKELDDIPDDYKTTIAKTLQARQAVGDNVEELKNLYKNLGYEETDPMIMVNDNGGTVLKPVKVKKTENAVLDEDEDNEETLEEAINRAHQEEISAIDTYDTVLSKTDDTTDTKLIDMINEIKADEEDHKLLLQHYIETGEALTDDELKELKDKSSEQLVTSISEAVKDKDKSVFEIDYANDDLLNTEHTKQNIVASVKNWLGNLANQVEIKVVSEKGPAGGSPIVQLIGNKEQIGNFLVNNYNAGNETIEDIYNLHLIKEVANNCNNLKVEELGYDEENPIDKKAKGMSITKPQARDLYDWFLEGDDSVGVFKFNNKINTYRVNSNTGTPEPIYNDTADYVIDIVDYMKEMKPYYIKSKRDGIDTVYDYVNDEIQSEEAALLNESKLVDSQSNVIKEEKEITNYYYEIHFKFNEDDEAPEGYSKFFKANKDVTEMSDIIELAKSVGELDEDDLADIDSIDYAKQIDSDEYKKATESKCITEALDGSTITEEFNTGVLPIVAVDMYSLSDSLNEYDISQEDLDEIVQELAPKYIEDTLREILPNVSVVTKSVYHPRQYNFEGDELDFNLTVDKQAYETLKENALNNPEFTTFLKDNYSSRSGFISSMADNIDEFKKQPEWKQMAQVIMFNIPNDKIQENNDQYVDEFLEKVSMSAGTIVDESKSINENEKELEFDPSNEVDEEAMNTEFKVGDVVADIVDDDTAVIEAIPNTADGKYTLRFVSGVCKGDAYYYQKGRFTMVTDEDTKREALEIYNANMKPEDNPLKKENLKKKEETVNKTFAEFKKNN